MDQTVQTYRLISAESSSK